jgi:hypothetical protein
VKIHRLFSIFMSMLGLSLVDFSAQAASLNRITYQGRIVRGDGIPLTGIVSFQFLIRSPNNCVLWAENFTNVDMTTSLGAYSFELGGGTDLSGAGLSFVEVFRNSGTFSSLTSCSVGTTYTPAFDDDRKVELIFNDGAGPQSVTPVAVKAVPYSLLAKNATGFGGKDISTTAVADGQVLQYSSVSDKWEPVSVGGTGTVTNIGLISSSIFSVTGGPITSAGSFSLGLSSVATGNFVLASPNGVGGVPTFRAIVAADIPGLAASQITSGTVAANVGGTGLVPSAGNANKVYALNAAGTGTEFKAISAGSGVIVDTSVAGVISIAATGSGGSVTSVSAGTGLLGGPIMEPTQLPSAHLIQSHKMSR